jgi:hypothetical protein
MDRQGELRVREECSQPKVLEVEGRAREMGTGMEEHEVREPPAESCAQTPITTGIGGHPGLVVEPERTTTPAGDDGPIAWELILGCVRTQADRQNHTRT